MREGKWKLVRDTLNQANRWQLFNVEADRTETTDLAGQHPDLVRRLGADYERWAGELGRRMPGQKGRATEE